MGIENHSGEDYEDFDDEGTLEKFKLTDTVASIGNLDGYKGMSEEDLVAAAKEIIASSEAAELEEASE